MRRTSGLLVFLLNFLQAANNHIEGQHEVAPASPQAGEEDAGNKAAIDFCGWKGCTRLSELRFSLIIFPKSKYQRVLTNGQISSQLNIPACF